jgi:hypothetical protein
MVVLRLLAHHFVERFSPSGMLLGSSILMFIGLYLLSFVTGLWSSFAVATLFAWGVAFFFPTMVGSMSERLPRTGSLGIVLMAGVGLGMAGAVGVPAMGRLTDRFLAENLPPVETIALLERVEAGFPAYLQRAQGATEAQLGYQVRDVQEALDATGAALAAYRADNAMDGDLTANALRAISGSQLPNEPAVGEAAGLLGPAEAEGGQHSFRYVAPIALILFGVFLVMYLNDRRKGGYRAARLERTERAGAV